MMDQAHPRPAIAGVIMSAVQAIPPTQADAPTEPSAPQGGRRTPLTFIVDEESTIGLRNGAHFRRIDVHKHRTATKKKLYLG